MKKLTNQKNIYMAINGLEMMRNSWKLESKHNEIDTWVQNTAIAVEAIQHHCNGSNEQKWPLRKTLTESNKIMSMIYKVNIGKHKRI